MHNNPPPKKKVLQKFPCDAHNNKNYQSLDKVAWLLPHELAAVLSYIWFALNFNVSHKIS